MHPLESNFCTWSICSIKRNSRRSLSLLGPLSSVLDPLKVNNFGHGCDFSQLCHETLLFPVFTYSFSFCIFGFPSLYTIKGFSGGSAIKNPPVHAGDTGDVGSIPGSGRSPGEGNGSPCQYSCLGNPTDRGALRAAVHGVTKSRTWLST